MTKKIFVVGILVALFLLFAAKRLGGIAEEPKKLTVTSGSFKDGDFIPREFTCDADDKTGISPEIVWAGAPENTVSFVIIAYDPDSSGSIWTHWILYNIPAKYTVVPANDVFITTYAKYGINSWIKPIYQGP